MINPSSEKVNIWGTPCLDDGIKNMVINAPLRGIIELSGLLISINV